jgi:sugar-phosphatase
VTLAVLSDLDGVLVDSTEAVERAWAWWAVQHGLEPALVQAVAHGRPTRETIREVAPHLDIDAETVRLEAHEAADVDGLVVIPGAPELFRDTPRDRIAVVTSGTALLARSRLNHVGLPIPDVFVTADQVERGKPDPEGYLKAARALGAHPSDCIVLEDAPAGIAAGLAANMTVFALLTSHPRAELDGAHVFLNDLRELNAALAGRPRTRARPA